MDDHEVELQSRKKLMEHPAWKVFVFEIFGDFWQYIFLFSPNEPRLKKSSKIRQDKANLVCAFA